MGNLKLSTTKYSGEETSLFWLWLGQFAVLHEEDPVFTDPFVKLFDALLRCIVLEIATFPTSGVVNDFNYALWNKFWALCLLNLTLPHFVSICNVYRTLRQIHHILDLPDTLSNLGFLLFRSILHVGDELLYGFF